MKSSAKSFYTACWSFVVLSSGCMPDIGTNPRPDVVIADLDPKADLVPFPFDGLVEKDPAQVIANGYSRFCDLSRCPEDPDDRPLSPEKCLCVDFQEWDEVPDDKAEFERKMKQKLHLLDGFPVTATLSASFSNEVDQASLERSLKMVRSWDGEQQSAANDVPKLSASITKVDYQDPDDPGDTSSRWLATIRPNEPLLQRKTYLVALRATDPVTGRQLLHGVDKTTVPAYSVTQRFVDGKPNPQCDAILDDTRCKVFNESCIEPPSVNEETCETYWPVVQDAATWFALSDTPLCEYKNRYTSEQLLELYKHHSLPACLESTTSALDNDDAADLEELRVALNEVLDDEAIQTSLNLDRKSTALIWAMTTQSVAMDVQRARLDLYTSHGSDQDPVKDVQEADDLELPAGVGSLFRGMLRVPDFRNPDGLLELPLKNDASELQVPFLLALPEQDQECSPPFEFVIVVPGIGGSKSDMLGTATSLSRECMASLALDLPGQGDHPVEDLWIDDPFLLAGTLEQAVVEQLQAVRAVTQGFISSALARIGQPQGLIKTASPGLLAGSLGSIIGVMVMAVEPDVMVGVLSSPARDWHEVLSSFEAAGYAPKGISEKMEKWRIDLGPRQIDVFSWVMEKVDPAAYARIFRFRRMMALDDLVRRQKVPMKDKKILIQVPTEDDVLAQGSSHGLAESFGSNDPTTVVVETQVPGGHRVIFDQGRGHDQAAAQAARFIASQGSEVLQ